MSSSDGLTKPAGDVPEVVIAGTASKWASTINWAQILSLVAIVFGIFNIAFPSELQNQVIAGVMGVCGLIDLFTYIRRTYFTTHILKESVRKTDPIMVIPNINEVDKGELRIVSSIPTRSVNLLPRTQ